MKAGRVRGPGWASALDGVLFSTIILSCLAYSVSIPAAGEYSTAGMVGLVAMQLAALCAYLLERRARPGNRLGRGIMILLATAFVYRFWRDYWIEAGVIDWLRRMESLD